MLDIDVHRVDKRKKNKSNLDLHVICSYHTNLQCFIQNAIYVNLLKVEGRSFFTFWEKQNQQHQQTNKQKNQNTNKQQCVTQQTQGTLQTSECTMTQLVIDTSKR